MNGKTLFIPSPQGQIPCCVYTPTGYDPTKRAMVVVGLHGSGQMGDGSQASLDKFLNHPDFQQLFIMGDKYGFVVITPQLVTALEGYYPGFKPWYTDIAVQYALDNYSAYTQVGGFGYSLGGGGLWEAMQSTDQYVAKFFAVVPCCPTPVYDGDFSLIGKHHLPVWDFHAVDDATINVIASQNMVAKANSYNPSPLVKYSELATGGHGIWGTVEARDDVWQWMLAQPKTALTPGPNPPPQRKVTGIYQLTTYDVGNADCIRIS
jgi:predicted peptidase